MSIFLGIDIGGSSLKYGWGSLHSGLLHFGTLKIQQRNLQHLHSLTKEILELADSSVGLHNLSAIGIGSAGIIDCNTRLLTGVNPNLPFWTNQCPADLIPSSCKLPVYFDNDANLMALAEASISGYSNALGITIGSGIGCGIIVNGKVYQGAHGFAGELGHVCVVSHGAACSCGKMGCLEAYCSVYGLRSRLAEVNPVYTNLELSEILQKRDTDKLINDTIASGESLLCRTLANAITFFDPEVLIIGGGGMEAGLYSIEKLSKEITSFLAQPNADRTAICKALQGNKAGVLGAIILAEKSLSPISE